MITRLFARLPKAGSPPPGLIGLDAAAALVVALATVLVFIPVAGHGFLIWDDPGYVTGNLHVRQGLTLDNLAWAATAFQMGNWHPLTMLSHTLDVTLFGDRAAGHHASSLVLHVLGTLAFLVFLRRVGTPAWPAAVAALVFAVHPLHVESVAWVSARKDVLCGLFWMLALIAYVGYARAPGLVRYLGVTLLFAAALMSKAAAVTLPCVMLLLDAWPLRRIAGGTWRELPGRAWPLLAEKLPWLAMSAGLAAVTVLAQQRFGAVTGLSGIPLADRPILAALAYAHFIGDSLVPLRLSYLHELRPPLPGVAAGVAAGLLLALLSAGAWRLRRRAPWFGIGWLWFLGVLVPMIGIVHVGQHARADRYMYLPLAGLLLAFAWALASVPARWRSPALAAAASWVLVLGWLAHDYAKSWQSTETAFAHAVAVDPGHCQGRLGLANVLINRGDFAAARRHLDGVMSDCKDRKSQELAESFIGKTAHEQGRPDEAEAIYRRMLARWPDSIARIRLAGLLIERSRDEEAVDLLLAAEGDSPDDYYFRSLLGDALLRSNRHQQLAVERFGRWTAQTPTDPAQWFYLGVARERAADLPGSVVAYRRSLALAPDNETARLRLAQVLLRQGALAEAASEVAHALAGNPRSSSARNLEQAIAAAAAARQAPP